MITTISIPKNIAGKLRRHLFKSELEQGAFLFARVTKDAGKLDVIAEQVYLIPPEGWQVQLDVYLEMKDTERSKIMKMARDRDLAVVDCHSHPGSGDDVSFSPSDKAGITDFAEYTKWKLGGKPYVAMVWAESSLDAVIWDGDFTKAGRVDKVNITGNPNRSLVPNGSWFRKPRPYWQRSTNGH